MARPAVTFADSRGFALVEALVALAVSGLLLSGVASMVWASSHVHERVDRRTELVEDLTAIRRFLATIVDGVATADRSPVLASTMTSDRLTLTSFGPGSLALDEPEAFGLAVSETTHGGGDRTLVALWLSETGETRREETLAHGVRSASFRYFGVDDSGEAPTWRAEWASTDRPPQAIGLRLQLSDEPPIDFVFRVKKARRAADRSAR